MCLILTVCAALVFTLFYAVNKRKGRSKKSLLNAAFMFWGAAIMWSVDGISSVIGGESFFDISREDAVLGLIIVGAGLAVYAMMAVLENKRNLKA